jgi:hypothetical protein
MTRLVSEPTPANLISTMSPGVTDTNLFGEPAMDTPVLTGGSLKQSATTSQA